MGKLKSAHRTPKTIEEMGARKGSSQAVDLDEVYGDLVGRLSALRARLGGPEDGGPWRDYLNTIDLLLQIEDRLAHQEVNGRATLTTRERCPARTD